MPRKRNRHNRTSVCYGNFRTIYVHRRFSVGPIINFVVSFCRRNERTALRTNSNDVVSTAGFRADKVRSDWSRMVHCHRGYPCRGAAGRRSLCVPPTFDFYRKLINFRRTVIGHARVRQKRFARCKQKKDTPEHTARRCRPRMRIRIDLFYDYRSSGNGKKLKFCETVSNAFRSRYSLWYDQKWLFWRYWTEKFPTHDDVTGIFALKRPIWESSKIWQSRKNNRLPSCGVIILIFFL